MTHKGTNELLAGHAFQLFQRRQNSKL